MITFGCGQSYLFSRTIPTFGALEQALIQVWQPRLNTPFIYQFFNCKKGLIAQRPFCSSHQFGTSSLWCKLRWTSTPKRIRATLYSKRFHDRTALWEVIQHLGCQFPSNDFRWRNAFDHTSLDSKDAISFANLQPTWANLNDPML